MTTAADLVNMITRTDPLPVRLDEARSQILLHVGDVKVASAWGPAVDDPDTWFYWPGHCDPYRIGGGRDGAVALMEDQRDRWQTRERSMWHPDHGAIGDDGRVATVPADLVCEGCDQLLGGETGVMVVVDEFGDWHTGHYVCMNCECYLDDDGADDQ